MTPRLRLLTFTLALAGSLAGTLPAADWRQLRAGMSDVEARQQLGEPLLRSTSRGFDRWIYDGAGEVVFAGGPLQTWTVGSPSAESLARPVARDVPIRPVPPERLPALRRPAPVPAASEREAPAEETTFRYRFR